MKAVGIVSGGMDSVTLAHLLKREFTEVSLLSFDYGQRHVTELAYAHLTAVSLGLEHQIIGIEDIGRLLRGSALTDDNVDVPEGHYEEETMKQTVVPNRNMIMLSIAIGAAVARGADAVATAVHAGDHAVYPDCREEFIDELQRTARTANEGFINPHFIIYTPFINSTKASICKIGHEFGVDWTKTWSCYKGGEVHCGRCSTCVERAEAFALAGVEDPTEYRDPEYWKGVVNGTNAKT